MLPVSSNNVQVVIQDHCSETPLISPERKLCNWMPFSAVLWAVQGEDMSCTFCFWVIPTSQVLFPKAAESSVSLYPQVDNVVLLFFVQTTEVWIHFRDKNEKCSKLSPCSNSNISFYANKHWILDKMGHLQQVSTQVGEHCHLQLCTADLPSQTQIGPTVTWAEFICQDWQALW